MTRTALAPVFPGAGRIDFADRSYPDPGPGQLLLGVQANALCGTDRDQYFGGSSVVPGHEAAGTVVAAGEGTSVPVGSRGAVFLMDFCGECRSCRLGATNQCLAKRADMGFTHDGGYGPYELVHETNFFPVTDDIEIGQRDHVARRHGHQRPRARPGGAGPAGHRERLHRRRRSDRPRAGGHEQVSGTAPTYPCMSPTSLAGGSTFAESFGAIPIDSRTT